MTTDAAEPIRFDPLALARLRRWGGEKLLGEMVAMFLAHAPQRLAAARQGLRDGARDQAEREAHTLKSSCGQVGAVHMQMLCARIEQLAPEGGAAAIAGLLDEAERELALYRAWLSEVEPGLEEQR